MASSTTTSTQNNNNKRTETAAVNNNPMARFSIDEDDSDDLPHPITVPIKRQRLSESTTSQSPDEDEYEMITVGSDSEEAASEEEEEEEEEDDDIDEEEELEEAVRVCENAGSGGDGPVTEGQNHQQQQEVVDGELQFVLTDPDVLDCPICLDPLCTPVFQCENGHIACSLCCSKVKRKCPSCCMPIGYSRCRAIEKVIESVKVSCINAQYGCKQTMTYSKKSEHEQMCPHATCFCPHPSCNFTGSSKNLYIHFGIQHAASTTRFTYNNQFFVHAFTNKKYTFLQEQHESVIFILNHQLKEDGRVLNVDCVGPSTLKASFEFHITAKTSGSTLTLKCIPEVYTKWSENPLKKNYLMVPCDLSTFPSGLPIHLCIKKVVLPV